MQALYINMPMSLIPNIQDSWISLRVLYVAVWFPVAVRWFRLRAAITIYYLLTFMKNTNINIKVRWTDAAASSSSSLWDWDGRHDNGGQWWRQTRCAAVISECSMCLLPLDADSCFAVALLFMTTYSCMFCSPWAFSTVQHCGCMVLSH